MDARLPKTRIWLQRQGRIRAWADAHPEQKPAILVWLSRFRSDPFDPSLDPLPLKDVHGQAIYQYFVPGSDLVAVALVARYVGLDGKRLVRIILPRGAHDEIPDR